MEIESIITEHYIEMFWAQKNENGEIEYKTTTNLVSERNPLLFNTEANRETMAGFRFFDVRKVVVSKNPEDVIIGQNSNYSNMFYFGTRLGIEQMRDASALSRTVQLMEQAGSTVAILCYNGCFIINPPFGSLTVEEYKQMIEKNQQKDKRIEFKPVDSHE